MMQVDSAVKSSTKGKQAIRRSGSGMNVEAIRNASWRDFLANVQAGDLIREGFKLVCVDSCDSVPEALQVLKKNNVSSAPVWDKTQKGFIGFLDVFDVVCLLFDKFSLSDLEKGAKASQITVKEATNFSKYNPWCPVYIGKPLLSVMDMFSGGELHRIPILDEQGTIISLVSQSKVVEFLSDSIHEFGSAATKTVGECFTLSRPVVSVTMNESVFDAFLKLKTNRVTGIAVLDNDSALAGNFSANDVKAVGLDNLYGQLQQPIGELMKQASELFEKPFRALYCQTTDTLLQVLQTLTREQIHRLYIIDNNKQLLGIITLSDVIGVLDRLYS
jgi:5'-AMP-activated protein kinase regulatory gamma subunit